MERQELFKKLQDKTRFEFSDLLAIMDILRGENGCPWDREQTHQSIRSNCIEEAYEVVDAIDSGDADKLREELGDMMLQTVFHAAISKENGGFDFDDVVNTLCEKLVFRHTHIFGEAKAKNSQEALVAWDKAKEVEKSTKSIRDKIDALPKGFPTLLRAEKVLKYARKSSEVASDESGATAALLTKLEELLKSSNENNLGEFLLAAVNFWSVRSLDGEAALKKAVDKLSEKFE